MPLVQRLALEKRFEQRPCLRRVVTIALQIGNDGLLLGDVFLAAGDLPLGLLQVLRQPLTIYCWTLHGPTSQSE